MVRGYSDYTKGSTYGEVVARPALLFRTGRMILQELFDTPGIKWGTAFVGGGSSVIDTEHAYSGDGCLKQVTGVAAANTNIITKRIGVFPKSKIGLEHVTTLIVDDLDYLLVKIEYYDGTNRYEFSVKYDAANEKWQYVGAGGVYIDVPGGTTSLKEHTTLWHKIKLIVDISTLKYISLLVNNQSFDLAGLPARNVGLHADTMMVFTLSQTDDNAAAKTYYIDSITFTDEDL